MKPSRKFILFCFLIAVAYLPSLNHQFLSDDITGIVNNPDLLKFDLGVFWARPFHFLTTLIQFFTHQLFGANPAPYRLINLSFHLGSVYLIDQILNIMANPTLALAVAIIFAIHPIQTESITWISGSTYPQYGFFILLAFFFYLLAKKNKKFFCFSLLTLGLGLLSSEKAIVLPLILFFYSLAWGRLKKDWSKLLPFFGFAFLSVILLFKETLWRINTLRLVSYQSSQGLQNPLFQLPVAISSYFELLFWPINLSFYHSEMIFSQGAYLLRLGFLLAFLLGLVYTFKKNRFLFFWLMFFLIALSPSLTPLRIAWVVAERYVYLGAAGVIVLVVWLIQKFCPQKFFWPIILTITLLLLGRTLQRNLDWQNQDTLWLATAKTSPSSPQNHNNLGDLYARRGEFEKSAQEFQIAIKLLPGYADAYHNLANVYTQMGKNDLAVENYLKAIASNPNLWQSHRNLAIIYFGLGKLEAAKQELEKAAAINPQNANLQTDLAIVFLKMGQKTEAKAAIQRALLLDPQNVAAKRILTQYSL